MIDYCFCMKPNKCLQAYLLVTTDCLLLFLILLFIFKTGAFYEPEIDLPCCSYSTRLYYVRIFATGKMTIQARFSTVY